MNTNNLKRFAQQARKKLLEQTAARLEMVLHTDSAELREKAAALHQLQKAINRTSKEQVIEKAAYTWFNRLMALRFMDANGYQPIGIRVVTPKEDFTLPEILDEAKQGNIPGELPVKRQHIYDLLDRKIPAANPQNEAYKELLTGTCNHLYKVFPFLFERINDYTELLLPDDLTSDFSIVHDIREGMTTEDCQQVEIIGWLYQFYISEKKDEVFASKSKVKKEDIPAATQLFTPRWIVEYMVQNTVGKLWLQNKPNSHLREHMPYFIESPSVTADNYLKVNSVEEITLLDQACGSGHILVYAFELFSKIYEEEGYNPSEIPQLIIEKNLYGFEIDERAAQLAGFALMMKARAYHRRFFRKGVKPNILCFRDVKFTDEELTKVLVLSGLDKSLELQHDIALMENATNFGSLIIPKSDVHLLSLGRSQIEKAQPKADLFELDLLSRLKTVIEQLIPLNTKFHCVFDNPPYMGSGAMNKALSDFVKKNYPDSKSDLMACFMEAGLKALHPKGFLGMINQHSWMFLSSYEKLRAKLIENTFFDTLLHLGPRTFPEIGGEVVQNASFTFWNTTFEAKGSYIRLVDFGNSELKRTKTLEAIQNPNCGWFYTANQKDFEKIPGSPIGYWLSNKMIEVFENSDILDNYGSVRQGMATSDNSRFLKFWSEVSFLNIGISISDRKSAISSKRKWFPYNKGGSYRKWFGNVEYVVNWKDDGQEIKNFRDLKNSILSSNMGVAGLPFIFKPNVTWSKISAGKFSVRYLDKGFLFDVSGCSIFEDKILDKLLPLMNSKVITKLLGELSPTLNYEVGHVKALPIKSLNFDSKLKTEICINTSKNEWNSRETSWDFQQNELIKINGQNLEETYNLYQQYWQNKFFQLHKNEEELNAQFIEIYGLQEELTPDVPLADITILKEELNQKELKKLSDNYSSGWKLVNGKWNLQPASGNRQLNSPPTGGVGGGLPFNAKEIFAQFISYAVGCMFGRYSLDKPGLILANQGETLEDFVRIVTGDWWIVDSNNKIVFNPKKDINEYNKKFQRFKNMATGDAVGEGDLSNNAGDAKRGNIRFNESDKTGSGEHTEQYSGGTSEGDKGVQPLSDHSVGLFDGSANPAYADRGAGNAERERYRTDIGESGDPQQTNQQPEKQTPLTTTHQSLPTTHQTPLTTHHPPITYMPDADNIIPILNDEWFEDDITNRFHEFLKVSFGKENFEKNLHFIEDALGKDIRSYFVKDFYKDHIKRYKKRPIYWMFSSPKGSFNVLIYMHRYTPDTLNLILNNYLREYREKLNVTLETLEYKLITGTPAEQTKAARQKDRLKAILNELQEYERDILYPLAAERISIDLDDGVLVNYNKFGQAIKQVPGLNDPKTKKKVRGFDWIDTREIR